MGEYDWLDLSLHEHRVFLLHEANELKKEVDEYHKLRDLFQAQKRYIEELEKHLDILQRTLNVVHKNKKRRRVRRKWQNAECLQKQ